MKVLLAPDKFKGSLTARQVCDAMTEGIRLVEPDAEIVALPMADGGEGTAQLLTEAVGGHWHLVTVADPLGRPVEAGFGLSADGQTAFIEMAQASGLRLLSNNEYNPLLTSTLGTGQLIKAAIERGANRIMLGIGGSATNDGGAGMAAALGWQFLDDRGYPIQPCGGSLWAIHRIIPPSEPLPVAVEVACDVTNPLYGFNGAAHVYGPQKGASLADIELLDDGLRHLAQVIQNEFNLDLGHVPGAGAAGGLGAGALFFLKAKLKEGVQLVMEQIGWAAHLAGTDLVLTGEGKIDEQTLQGKLISGIARQSHQAGVPVIALCGTLALPPHQWQHLGLTAAFSCLHRPQSLTEALADAPESLAQATAAVIRTFLAR